MAIPLIGYGVAAAATAVVGWFGVRAGGEIVEDLDIVGDVAIAGLAGFAASRVSGSALVGVAVGATALGVMRNAD